MSTDSQKNPRALARGEVNQSKLSSFYEACMNIVIGFTINFFANLLIFPQFGFHISIGENFVMGVIYTGISLVRSYAIRRWFNARLHAAAQRLAGQTQEVV